MTSYTSRATEVEDEGNGSGRVTRILQKNALGDLVSVCEVTSQPGAGSESTPSDCDSQRAALPAPFNQGPLAGKLDLSATGFLTAYTDSPLGGLTGVQQGGENRGFNLDSLSRLLSATNPESGTTDYRYGSDSNCAAPNAYAGELVSRTDAGGVRTCFQYNADSRLTQENYSDGTPAAFYVYGQTSALGIAGLGNTLGRLSSEYTAADAGNVFSYDSVGRMAESWQITPTVWGSGAFSFAYQHDLAGDVTQSNFQNGAQVLTTSYNATQQPVELQSSTSGTLINGVTYGPWGRETAAELGAAPIAETRDYDGRGRPTLEQDGTLYNWTIGTYAPDGDALASVDSVNGSWAYTMNQMNQLTEACEGGCSSAAEVYGYDRYGNRWGAASSGAMPAAPQPDLTFNDGNHVVNPVWSYNADGDVLADGVNAYTFDAENRLKTATGSAVNAGYIYGPEGRRVQEDVGGVVKQFVYGSGGQKLTVLDASNNVLQEELYVGSRHLATYTPGGMDLDLTDWLGTTRMTASLAGGAIATYTSGPYGEWLSSIGGISNLHFTGKYRDAGTGFDDFGARYYRSDAGRFLTPDWSKSAEGVPYADYANPQSLNLYGYVLNNPATATDPDGHWCPWCWLRDNFDVAATTLENEFSQRYPGVSHSGGEPTELAGVDAADAVANARSQLISAQNFARTKFKPGQSETFCNFACVSVAKAVHAPMGPLTGADGAPLTANQIAANLAGSSAYQRVSPAEAQALANQGALVIGAWANPDGHGHVVTVRPEGVPGDHPFGGSPPPGVPLVNDIGGADRVSGADYAFTPSMQVIYYTPAGGGQ